MSSNYILLYNEFIQEAIASNLITNKDGIKKMAIPGLILYFFWVINCFNTFCYNVS